MLDYTDLFNHLCGYDLDDESESIEDDFYFKYNITREDAERLLDDLVPLAMLAKSPLTGTVYQGFGKDGLWLAKQEFHGGDTTGGG